MTLDKTITDFEKMAKHQEWLYEKMAKANEKKVAEHRQLAEWLKDYKRLKEAQPCDDAISRQDAIRLAEQGQIQGFEWQFKKLVTLPPITPQPEIVRCSQCKYAEVADSEDSQDGYTCQFHRGSIWFSGSYCSWGERRDKQ